MSHYLKSVWAMLSPFREERSPLLPHKPDDLEACVHGGPCDSDSVVLVCEPPHVPLYAHAHHVRVSPFSEHHFPLWSSGQTSRC